MGTTTFFLRQNDLSKPLNKMGKKELEKLDNLSPYEEAAYYSGWQVLTKYVDFGKWYHGPKKRKSRS